MTLTTSKGRTFDVSWAWAPAGEYGGLMLEYEDGRKISEIAADWEGCSHIHRESETEGNADYEGYTVLRIIARQRSGSVQITLQKEE